MSHIVKICGLSTPETLDTALSAGADMVGFVFFAKSPRHISFETARLLAAHHAGASARKVALTVDAGDDTLTALVEALQPHLLQLHGTESPERVAEIRTRFGLPIIKALGIEAAQDLAATTPYAAVADWLLLDAKATKDQDRPGGNGAAFDWSLLRGFQTAKPWLLAGGLDAGNVAGALAATGAPGVDVSSGVESAPGIKDAAKICAFVANARQATEELGSLRQSS